MIGMVGRRVKILRGKFVGCYGVLGCQSPPHPLASHIRVWQVYCKGKTLTYQESGFIVMIGRWQ